MEINNGSPDAQSEHHEGADLSEPATLPTTLLREAAKEATGRIARLQRELCTIQSALAAAREEEQLLSRLLAVRGGDGRALPSSPPQVSTQDPQPEVHGNSAPAQNLLTEVVAILQRAGRPLHISEILRVLTERKVPIPGAGRQANVISHVRRDERIARPSRGMYGLRAWGLEEMPVRPRPRKRRRTRITSSAAQKRQTK